MKLHTLKPAEGSTKNVKRIGRGTGSGHGGTSTRGHKGAKSRSGYSKKAGFEGGQMPLQRRIPKFGFKNVNRIDYKGINLSSIQKLAEKANVSEITFDVLKANGLVSKSDLIKLLGNGELKAKVVISAHAFSESAKQAIEKVGGSVNIIK